MAGCEEKERGIGSDPVLLFVERGKQPLHVEGEIGDTVIVSYCSNRANVDAFLSRVGGDMRSDLFKDIEDVSTTLVRWRSPFLGTRFAKKELS